MFRTVLALLLLMSCAVPVSAGPGHDHGDGGHEPAQSVTEVPRIVSVGSEVELVAIAEGHTLTIYLDRVDTNEPVDGAAIEVAGDGIQPALATRVAPGTYKLEADWLDQPGTKTLLFTVTTAEIADLLNGSLQVPDTPAAAERSATPLRELLARADVLAAVIGLLALGFFIAVALRPRRTSVAPLSAGPDATGDSATQQALKSAAQGVVLAMVAAAIWSTPASAGPGHDHGHDHGAGTNQGDAGTAGTAPRKLPDGSVFVPKPSQRLLDVRTQPAAQEASVQTRELIGTIVPDPSAFGQVQAPMDGQIEVSERGISFAGQKVQAGEVLALLTPTIPLADLGTMQQLRAEVDGKLIIAEQKLSRLTRIAGVVAQREIDDTKAERDALREQKRVLAPKGVEKVQLKAPVSGVISVATVRAGQVVNARDTLFEIVDPKRLWVEGIGSDIHSEGEIASATAIDAEGHAVKLGYVGRAPTLRQQSQPFLFRIEEFHAGLTIGAPVKVLVQTPVAAKGVVLPDAAIVRGANGLPQVWVKISAEHFKPVAVRTAPLDGARTRVLAGIEDGARVVIGGAELINQIR